MLKNIMFCLTIILASTFVTNASAGILMRHKGLSSHTDFSVYCKKEINFYVQSNVQSHYEGEKKDLYHIINSSRKLLVKKCPNLEKMVINGSLNNKWYFWGRSTKRENWQVIGDLIGDDDKYLEPYMFPKYDDFDSLIKLGYMYIAGERFVVDYGIAADMYRKGAKYGDANSQYHLGMLLDKGLVPHESNEKKRARKWLQKAADQGHLKAQEHLGIKKKNIELAEQQSIESAKAARKEGVVYKSDQFWQEFTDFNIFRKIFDGDFAGLVANMDFKNFYIHFVENYSKYCNSYLPAKKDPRRYTVIEIKNDQFGFEESRKVTGQSIFYIDSRFTPTYDQYHKEVSGYNKANALKVFWAMTQKTAQNGMGTSFNDALSQLKVFEMSKFYDKVNCDTATMVQMNENMLRAATSQPSIQSAGVVLKNAANESDSVESIVRKKTFSQACLSYHEKDSDVSGNYDDWCNCLSREARKVMKPDELTKYSNNFSLYYSEIDNKQEGPNDPRWRLQAPLNSCRR